MPLKREKIHRILIVKWSALGDVAISTAIIEDICNAFPAASLDLHTLPSAARLFEHDDRFDNIITIDVRERGKRLLRWMQWLRRVRASRYDLIVDLQASTHSRILIGLLAILGRSIPHRMGARHGFPYTLRPLIRDRNAHAFARMQSMLIESGIPAITRCPIIHLSSSQRSLAQQTLIEHGLKARRFAVFLPGSQVSGSLKRWGATRYAELGNLLLGGVVDRVAVITGPEEVDEGARIVDEINAAKPGAAVHLALVPLLHIGVLCEEAACIVANDTGTAHIAAAANRPMFVIFGLSDPRRAKPIGSKVHAIQAIIACANCYRKICPIADPPPCMIQVTPACVAHLITEPSAQWPGVRIS